MHKGAGVEGECVTLTEGKAVEALHGSNIYKYLGIKQLFDHRHKTVREELKGEYKRRMVTIWSSELSSKHKVDATNTWAVTLFRYFFPAQDGSGLT